MVHPALRVAGHAEVVADVLVPDFVDAQLGAVVEDADAVRVGLHGMVVPEPKDLRLRGALRLAVQDDRVANIDVRKVVGGSRESRGS